MGNYQLYQLLHNIPFWGLGFANQHLLLGFKVWQPRADFFELWGLGFSGLVSERGLALLRFARLGSACGAINPSAADIFV